MVGGTACRRGQVVVCLVRTCYSEEASLLVRRSSGRWRQSTSNQARNQRDRECVSSPRHARATTMATSSRLLPPAGPGCWQQHAAAAGSSSSRRGQQEVETDDKSRRHRWCSHQKAKGRLSPRQRGRPLSAAGVFFCRRSSSAHHAPRRRSHSTRSRMGRGWSKNRWGCRRLRRQSDTLLLDPHAQQRQLHRQQQIVEHCCGGEFLAVVRRIQTAPRRSRPSVLDRLRRGVMV